MTTHHFDIKIQKNSGDSPDPTLSGEGTPRALSQTLSPRRRLESRAFGARPVPPPQTETLATPLKVSGKYGKRGGIRGKRDRDEEMDRKGM